MGRRKKGRAISGWLNFDKPLDMGSTQAVSKIRHLFDAQKAGHAGTLDPLASGILPIALGEATKTVSFMQNAAKTYEVTVIFGAATRTDDAEGEIVARSDKLPEMSEIEAVLPDFCGEIEQVPPQFSAIKQQGARAYDLARAGKTFDLSPRRVRIDAITLLARPAAHQLRLKVDCGKGVYIRSLARDLGRALGSCAHVGALRRTKVGPFEEKTALGLDKLDALGHSALDLAALEACLSPLETVLDDIPALALSADQASRIRQGQAISPPQAVSGDTVLLCFDGRALALADYDADAYLIRPRRVFNL